MGHEAVRLAVATTEGETDMTVPPTNAIELSGTLAGNDGPSLAWRRWTTAVQPRASVVVLHGLGEHAGRYGGFANQLAAAGFAVTVLDYEGFGKSSGRRGDVRYEPTCDALDLVIADERVRSGGAPVVLYGNSLGGLYAFLYAVDRGAELAGVVLSGPAFDSELRRQRLKIGIARLAGRIYPTLSLPNGLRFERMNRSPEAAAERMADPLVHGRATARFAVDVVAQMDRVAKVAPGLQVPLLVVHGDADLINPLSGSREVVRKVADATLKSYPGVHHGLKEEPEGPAILGDVIDWLDALLKRHA